MLTFNSIALSKYAIRKNYILCSSGLISNIRIHTHTPIVRAHIHERVVSVSHMLDGWLTGHIICMHSRLGDIDREGFNLHSKIFGDIVSRIGKT